MYRADGPEEFRVVGETEFVQGVAAMSASGAYGEMRAATGIVGAANLCIGCLLYTSDAAHEEDSVDLGGRRIIKKKFSINFRH